MRMEPPYPEHRAANDVEAMGRLFAELGVSAENFQKKEPAACAAVPREKPSRRKRNADIVNRVEYNYIYAEGGSVFHRRECRHCLGAKTIHGSVYYETAAEGRRPCKICKPIPSLGLTQTRTQIPKKKPRPDAAVETKLLGGRTELLRPTAVVGWCKYNQHPGALTARILKEHRCLQVHSTLCRGQGVAPYSDRTYWSGRCPGWRGSDLVPCQSWASLTIRTLSSP